MPNLVNPRKSVISLPGSDDQDLRRQQITFNGKAVNAEIWAPYGVSYNVPVGSMGMHIQIGGDSGNLLFFPDRSQDRVKDLKEGEVAFFNPLTQTRNIYRTNGDLEIVTAGDNGDLLMTIKKNLTINVAGDATIDASGDADVIAGGDVNITASSNVNVSGSQINLN